MSLHTRLARKWQYALLAGVPVAPIAIWSYVQSSGNIELTGLWLVALAAGYLAKRRGLEATPVGVRTGLVAAAPVTLWFLADVAWSIRGFHQPVWMTAAQGLVLLVFAALSLAFGALVGAVAARVGGWLAERNGHPRGGTPA